LSVPRNAWRASAFPLALLAVAELSARLVNLQSDSLAAPSDVAFALYEAAGDGTLWHATRQTAVAALGGLALGGSIGVLIGIVFGLAPRLGSFFALSVELMRPLPAIALIPLSLLAFGFGDVMEIAVVAFGTLWPALILAHRAVAAVEPRLLDVARVMHLGMGALIRKIVLPSIAPRLFTAIRLSAGIALVIAVTVEITANPQGLGYALMMAQQTLRPATMLAMLIWLGLLGWVVNFVLLWLESHLFAYAAPERENAFA
jgi:ABC-type nitrate/sulfonate/bicarbonate transport system permease component